MAFWRPGASAPGILPARPAGLGGTENDDDDVALPHLLSTVSRRGGVTSSASASHHRGLPPLPAERRVLPIYEHRVAILHALECHGVVIIVGETGSGKSTRASHGDKSRGKPFGPLSPHPLSPPSFLPQRSPSTCTRPGGQPGGRASSAHSRAASPPRASPHALRRRWPPPPSPPPPPPRPPTQRPPLSSAARSATRCASRTGPTPR